MIYLTILAIEAYIIAAIVMELPLHWPLLWLKHRRHTRGDA